jgi:hypothetical protein
MELQLRLPGDWPVGQDRRTRSEPDADDVESMVTWLQEIEINAWIQTTPPAHIAAGIHDPNGGEDIWDIFHPVGGVWPRGEIARWLVETARYHYPRARGTQ